MSAKNRKHPRCNVQHRFVVSAKAIERYLPLIQHTGQSMKIQKRKGSESYSRFIFSGVPAKHVDLVIQDALLVHACDRQEHQLLEIQSWQPEAMTDDFQSLMLEVGLRAGCYDLKERDRLSLKGIPNGNAKDFPAASVRIVRIPAEDNREEIMVIIRWDGGQIIKEYPVVAIQQGEFSLERVFWWQWSHWYRFLDRSIVEPEAANFIELGNQCLADWDLNFANRAAGQFLYRIARRNGWKKLRADQLARLGFDISAGAWQREDRVTEAYARLGHPTGCGEATLRAANGGSFEPWERGEGDSPLTDAELLELEFEE